MSTLTLKILTPTEVLYEGEVAKATIPASDGELGVLPQHAPLIGALGTGPLTTTESDGTVRKFAVYGGLLEILRGQVTVLAAGADADTDIVPAVAKKEIELAQAKADHTIDAQEARVNAIHKAKVRASIAKGTPTD